MIGGSRLAAGYALGVVLWGVPLALIGIEPNLVAALVLLAVLGVGDSLTEVAGLDAPAARVAGRAPGARVRRARDASRSRRSGSDRCSRRS